MSKSSAARSKAWRDTMKNSEEFRAKEAERKRIYRQKVKVQAASNPLLAKKLQLEGSKRLKSFRERKKELARLPALQPYTCKQTLAKAVRKAERGLPLGSLKRRKVIEVLCNKNKAVAYMANSSHSVEDMDIKLIQDFFVRDDISVQAPGRKETVLIGAEKIPTPKSYVYDNDGKRGIRTL